jgi:ribosomal protein S12 methylthiotransferase
VKTKSHTPTRINIVTLGCSKNLVDSENLLTQLRAGDLDATHESARKDANVVIVNTCGFIDRAKEESIDTILHYAQQKQKGRIEKLFVTGCLSERYRDDLRIEMPEVDGFYGTFDMPDLLARFGVDYKQELIGERRITTPGHYAYLKISEGCNRPCAFCAIPLMRGKHVSRSIESLVEEAQFLVSRGVKELMLIAQELTFYGIDLYGERRLADLLNALADVQGLEWIRLHYAYPAGFPTEILPVIAARPNICNYLDIPLQHAADNVLRAMRRGITRAKTEELIERIRTEVPGIALRTTLLVGFPGETEADHQELLRFVEWARFDRLGVFQYSHEEKTHAFGMPDDVPEDVKQRRADEVMALQETISTERNEQRVGQTLRVLIDRTEGEFAIGRTEYDSPEVDNEVIVPRSPELRVGSFVNVHIERTEAFDLFGVVV